MQGKIYDIANNVNIRVTAQVSTRRAARTAAEVNQFTQRCISLRRHVPPLPLRRCYF